MKRSKPPRYAVTGVTSLVIGDEFMCKQFMDAEPETSYMHMYPSNHPDHWISYIELNFIVFFSPSRKWFPLLKKANFLDFFLQFTEAKLYSI